jgi:RNA polymerase sigma-70 factor (ECF subfamily)
VAYYKVLAFRKSSQREQARLSQAFIEQLARQSATPKEASDTRHQALVGCLQTLRPPQRDLLMRYYAGEQSLQQIAEDEGQTFAALRQRVVRLRKALARCIERRLPAEVGS